MKHTDMYQKTASSIEDSFDDHDFVDTYDYNNEEEEEEPIVEENEKLDDPDLAMDDDMDTPEEMVGDLDEATSTGFAPEEKREYGSVKGIRHYTDPDFVVEKARKLFYEGDEKDQIEALLYAQYYARRTWNAKPAHSFIMRILTKDVDKCSSHDVYEQAQMSFYYFFRTYLLRECQKFADRRMIEPSQREEFISEALQTCHSYVFKALPGYDVDSGYAVSTYFQPFIKDALTNWESLRKGRSSKSTMRTDAAVANAQKELLEEGIIPTPVLVALRSHKKVEETKNSMSRIKAENTMVSKEANELVVGSKKQTTFLEPDKSFIQSERTAALIEALKTLRPDQRKVFCYTLGIEYDEVHNRILDTNQEHLSLKQVSLRMNLDIGEVKALQVSAKRQLARAIRKYTDAVEPETVVSKDTFLHDRHMIFSSTKEDDDMMEIIGEITSISDSSTAADQGKAFEQES